MFNQRLGRTHSWISCGFGGSYSGFAWPPQPNSQDIEARQQVIYEYRCVVVLCRVDYEIYNLEVPQRVQSWPQPNAMWVGYTVGDARTKKLHRTRNEDRPMIWTLMFNSISTFNLICAFAENARLHLDPRSARATEPPLRP